MATKSLLPADVAAVYELTGMGLCFYVQQWGHDVDLRRLTLAEADALMALPGGFEPLRRKAAKRTRNRTVKSDK